MGYTVYVDLIRPHFPHKEWISTPMRQEVDRCRAAIEAALSGKDVAVVCSGDAGVYGMAGLILELLESYPAEQVCRLETQVIPGITAACGGAAVLGAPLMHDFAVISLSDLLTPWEQIAQRLALAAQGDFVICLYNPASKKRQTICKRPALLYCSTSQGKPFADWSGTSAGKGNPHGSSPFPPCGIPRQICLPPSISAIGRPGRSTSGW